MKKINFYLISVLSYMSYFSHFCMQLEMLEFGLLVTFERVPF